MNRRSTYNLPGLQNGLFGMTFSRSGMRLNEDRCKLPGTFCFREMFSLILLGTDKELRKLKTPTHPTHNGRILAPSFHLEILSTTAILQTKENTSAMINVKNSNSELTNKQYLFHEPSRNKKSDTFN